MTSETPNPSFHRTFAKVAQAGEFGRYEKVIK
jgi:hypothetical protein